MSLHDLTFSVVSSGLTIYDPHSLTSGSTVVLRVTNDGLDDLVDLGMYVEVTTNLGDVDNPADFPPETDYQDLIGYGEAVDAAIAVAGGIQLTLPQTGGGNVTTYVSRQNGSLLTNKLAFQDLDAAATADFTVDLETPPAVAARRLFINLVLA